MLEGKEFEGKIGEYGTYSVDVHPDAHVDIEGNGKIEKSFFGLFTIKGNCDLGVRIDLVGGLEALVKDSKSTILTNLVGGVAKVLRG